jgi:hypothetical protein
VRSGSHLSHELPRELQLGRRADAGQKILCRSAGRCLSIFLEFAVLVRRGPSCSRGISREACDVKSGFNICQPLSKKPPYLLSEHASRKRVTSGNTLVSITLRLLRFFAAETRKRIFATIRCVPYSWQTSWVGIMRRCLVLIVPLPFVSAIADAARADDWQDGYGGCQKIYNAKRAFLRLGGRS